MKAIVCAVDFSDAGKGVVATAAREARLRQAKLWLIHAAAPEPDFVGYDVGPDNERQFRAQTLRAEHEKLQRRAEELTAEGVETAALLAQGPTAETLVRQADELQAEMLVIGSHRHGTWHQIIWGATEESVIARAHCPVLVVPVRQP